MKSFNVPSCYCPQCNHPLEIASTMPHSAQAIPKPGSFSVCINCGQISKFGHDMRMELPTRAEVRMVMREVPEALMVRKFIYGRTGRKLFRQLVSDGGGDEIEVIGVSFKPQ